MSDMRWVEHQLVGCAMRNFDCFRAVRPRELRFGEWYFTTGEVRRVPLSLALPRRLVRRLGGPASERKG